jgi:hypothetical protein
VSLAFKLIKLYWQILIGVVCFVNFYHGEILLIFVVMWKMHSQYTLSKFRRCVHSGFVHPALPFPDKFNSYNCFHPNLKICK